MPASRVEMNLDVLAEIVRAIYADRRADNHALKNFSLVSKSARAAAMPFLFRSVAARQCWDVDGLRELRELTVINSYVRTFTFAPDQLYDMIFRIPRGVPLPKDNLEQISHCIALLADVLRGYNSLGTLVFYLRDGLDAAHPEKVLSMLQRSALHLPCVRTLSIEENAVPVFVGGVCPGVTDLSVLDRGQVSLGRWPPAANLTRLELREFSSMWRYNKDAGVIAKVIGMNMPNIRSLTVDCRLYSGTIESQLAVFYGLCNLQVLSIASIEDSVLKYYPPQSEPEWADMPEEEQVYHERDAADALKRIKRVAKERFPRLKYLWLGAGSLILFDFSQLKSNDVEALDQLPPAWVAYGPDHEKELAALVGTHPECERFLMGSASYRSIMIEFANAQMKLEHPPT